jgi:hypothetical protein
MPQRIRLKQAMKCRATEENPLNDGTVNTRSKQRGNALSGGEAATDEITKGEIQK